MSTYTDVITFTEDGTSFDLTLTVVGSDGTGTVSDITGTVGGVPITGLDYLFEGPSNTVTSTTSPQFDTSGLSFVSNGDTYNLYNAGGSLAVIDSSGTYGGDPISNETFTATAGGDASYFTDVVSLSDNGENFNLTLTVLGSGGTGTVTAISGTADGMAITGLDSAYGGPDQTVVSTTAAPFDGNGLSFDTATDTFNISSGDGTNVYVTDTNGTVDDTTTASNVTISEAPSTFTDVVTFTDDGTSFDLTLTVAGSTGTGTGTVAEITGTVGGDAISGLDYLYDQPSNQVTSTTAPQFDGGGLSFVSNGDTYNLSNVGGSLVVNDNNGAYGGDPIDDETFTATPGGVAPVYTDELSFTDNGDSFDLTLTVLGSGGTGTVTAISGTADGMAITGLDATYNSPDQTVVSTTEPQFDGFGLSFDTAGDEFTIYSGDGANLQVTDNNGLFTSSTNIADETFTDTPLCFLRGTHIATPAGEVPVQDLAIGDTVTTLAGHAATIRWIGQGKMMCPPGRRSAATPVLVRRHALAENVPSRDLRVTKGHALYVDGVLVPAEFLVNHRSIVWDDAAREVEFFHLELPSHDVILADGAPAESYRDEGNRWMFHNANPAWDQPGIAPYAPVLTGGSIVDAIWQRLLHRAGAGTPVPTTIEPDLHLLVDGLRVDAVRQDGNVFVFPLPALAESVVIASRASAQDELGRARDPRLLGVAISRIEVCCGGAGRHAVGADALTGAGFHGHEKDEGCTWTNGHAALPPATFAELAADALRIHLRHTTHYALPEKRSRLAA